MASKQRAWVYGIEINEMECLDGKYISIADFVRLGAQKEGWKILSGGRFTEESNNGLKSTDNLRTDGVVGFEGVTSIEECFWQEILPTTPTPITEIGLDVTLFEKVKHVSMVHKMNQTMKFTFHGIDRPMVIQTDDDDYEPLGLSEQFIMLPRTLNENQ